MESVRSNGGSSAGGFRIVMEAALQLPTEEIVYFMEDDYLHLTDSRKILLEGLTRAHYITLYDHPDKYIPAEHGGNPLIDLDGAEETKVFRTNTRHWKLTNSTTMTFASTVNILREDEDILRSYTQGSYPRDFEMFLALRNKGRALVTPIPGYATHGETTWLSPLTNWELV